MQIYKYVYIYLQVDIVSWLGKNNPSWSSFSALMFDKVLPGLVSSIPVMLCRQRLLIVPAFSRHRWESPVISGTIAAVQNATGGGWCDKFLMQKRRSQPTVVESNRIGIQDCSSVDISSSGRSRMTQQRHTSEAFVSSGVGISEIFVVAASILPVLPLSLSADDTCMVVWPNVPSLLTLARTINCSNIPFD